MVESTSSCENISSPSTETESYRQGGPAQESAVLSEINQFRRILAAHASTDAGGSWPSGERLLAITCFVPGMPPERWQALVAGSCEEPRSSGLTSWLALELDPEQYPQLYQCHRQKNALEQIVCPLTGALLPAAFQRHLANAVHTVPLAGQELSLLLFEIIPSDSLKDSPKEPFNGPFTPSDLDPYLCSLIRMLRLYERVCDTPGRLANNCLAILLPGMGPFRSRAFAERFLNEFDAVLAAQHAQSGMDDSQRHYLRIGIACYDPQDSSSSDLIAQAKEALKQALPGFTRTYRKKDAPSPERKTQVQAAEKQYLFFGSTK